MNHTLALVAALAVAVASPAASSAEELRTLELAPPDPTAWTLPPGWSIEPLALMFP